MPTTITRYHDFCAGHRVYGHESKCSHLHGHNYRVFFTLAAPNLDQVGRIIDFSVIKEKLCSWLEAEWDHRFLVFDQDPIASFLLDIDKTVVKVPFNPTAENMAQYLVEVTGPHILVRNDVVLQKVTIEETRKCSATYALWGPNEYFR